MRKLASGSTLNRSCRGRGCDRRGRRSGRRSLSPRMAHRRRRPKRRAGDWRYSREIVSRLSPACSSPWTITTDCFCLCSPRRCPRCKSGRCCRRRPRGEQGRGVQIRKTKMTSPGPAASADRTMVVAVLISPPSLPSSHPLTSPSPRRLATTTPAQCAPDVHIHDQENGLQTPPTRPPTSRLVLVLLRVVLRAIDIDSLIQTARLCLNSAYLDGHGRLGEGAVADGAVTVGRAPGPPYEGLVSPVRLHHPAHAGYR